MCNQSYSLLKISKSKNLLGMEQFKPIVKISFRNKEINSILYKRRLRISFYTAILLDNNLKTNFFNQRFSQFLPVPKDNLKQVCEVLQIEYKDCTTYLHLDSNLCSFHSDNFLKKSYS